MESNTCNFCQRALALTDLKKIRSGFICLECLKAAEIAAGVRKEDQKKGSLASCIFPLLVVLVGLFVDACGYVWIGSIGIMLCLFVWFLAGVIVDSRTSNQEERPEAVKRLSAIYAMFIELPPDWRARRHAVRIRDKSRCQHCGKRFVSDFGFHVHHKIPKSNKEGNHELENLALLCEKCHKTYHPWMT